LTIEHHGGTVPPPFPEAKMDMLFLPGLICDDAIWVAQAADLSRLGSPRIADLTQDETIAGMAARALVDAPERFALVAVSMGGYVAFEIMRQAPERVTALALFDTSAGLDSPARAARRHASIASLALGRFAGVTNRMLRELIHPSLVSGPVGEAIKDMAGRVGGEAFLRQQRAILGRPDSRPTLAQVNVPTLVAVGDGDVLTPPGEVLAVHIGIRSSQFRLIRDCGHLPPLEHPGEVSAMLREFLSPLRT
jgi:pimeloyl-ACP methyl ester carboxylesterase